MAKKVLEEIKEEVKKCCKINELHIVFPNEDMNKLVEKINEIIKKYNGN